MPAEWNGDEPRRTPTPTSSDLTGLAIELLEVGLLSLICALLVALILVEDPAVVGGALLGLLSF